VPRFHVTLHRSLHAESVYEFAGSAAPLPNADDWDLFIETDSERRVASGTRLVFPIELGGRQVRLRCRPADGAQAGTNALDGRFLVECATCENAESGKAIE
jgi:hypothetical protein